MATVTQKTSRTDFRFLYDETLLEDLRQSVPITHRLYDSDRNTFSVWAPYQGIAYRIFISRYPDAETVGDTPREWSSEAVESSESHGKADEDSGYLYVVSDAPEAVYRAAYRAMVRLYHPDVNAALGSNARIQEINAVWERICRKKGWTR